MARKRTPQEAELRRRLRVAHRSAKDMSDYAGRLRERVAYLERAVAARDLLIEHLKAHAADNVLFNVRLMQD
jgi:hypothetical protein